MKNVNGVIITDWSDEMLCTLRNSIDELLGQRKQEKAAKVEALIEQIEDLIDEVEDLGFYLCNDNGIIYSSDIWYEDENEDED